MSLADDVELEEYVMAKDDLSGADIKAICTEAGLMALRERRMRVNKADFTTAREKVRRFRLDLQRKRLMTIVRYCTRRTRVRLRDCICDICTP
jgi:ATP-dependent 26S proteasome regulatory subunit